MRAIKIILLAVLSFSFLCFRGNREGLQRLDDNSADDSLITIDLDNMIDCGYLPIDTLYSGYSYVKDKRGGHFNDDPSFGKLSRDEKGNFIISDWISGTFTVYDSCGNNIKTYRGLRTKGELSHEGEFYTGLIRGSGGYGKMCIVDDSHSSVKVYSYGGNYLRKIPVMTIDLDEHPDYNKFMGGALCDDAIPLKNGNILIHYAFWRGNLPYNYALVNEGGGIISKRKSMGSFNGHPAKLWVAQIEDIHYIYNNELYIKDWADTVYVIRNNIILPRYVFKSKRSLSRITDSLGSNVDLFADRNLSLNIISSMQETKNYIFFAFYPFPPAGGQVNCYYDKREQKTCRMFNGVYGKQLKFRNQEDTSDFIYSDCFVHPIFKNSSLGFGRHGRVRLYIRTDQK